MGARKANRAEKLKAEKKQKAIAVMRDCPTSPRKMPFDLSPFLCTATYAAYPLILTPDRQVNDIQNLISDGVNLLVVAAIDGEALNTVMG